VCFVKPPNEVEKSRELIGRHPTRLPDQTRLRPVPDRQLCASDWVGCGATLGSVSPAKHQEHEDGKRDGCNREPNEIPSVRGPEPQQPVDRAEDAGHAENGKNRVRNDLCKLALLFRGPLTKPICSKPLRDAHSRIMHAPGCLYERRSADMACCRAG
jgi:hypothetical protein